MALLRSPTPAAVGFAAAARSADDITTVETSLIAREPVSAAAPAPGWAARGIWAAESWVVAADLASALWEVSRAATAGTTAPAATAATRILLEVPAERERGEGRGGGGGGGRAGGRGGGGGAG